MIRFLIMLEIVLVALLAVRWLDSGAVLRAGDLPAVRSVANWPHEGPASSALPLAGEDRTRLTHDLLGRATGDAPVTASSSMPALEASPSIDAKERLSAPGPDGLLQTKPEEPWDTPEQTMAKPQIAEAQRLLTRLGYSAGPADGVWGQRSQRALVAWQRRSGRPQRAPLDLALLAQMRNDVRKSSAAMASARHSASVAASRRAASAAEQGTDHGEPAWLASIAGGFQRLLGHQFDSRTDPKSIRDYCAANRDTWIFDEGSRSFHWCGRDAPRR